MTEKLKRITLYKGEEYPVEADFRAKCKRIGSNLDSATHEAETTGIFTLGTSSLSGNIASVVVTAAAKGCAILKSTGTTDEGYDLIGKCEIEVIDPTECSS